MFIIIFQSIIKPIIVLKIISANSFHSQDLFGGSLTETSRFLYFAEPNAENSTIYRPVVAMVVVPFKTGSSSEPLFSFCAFVKAISETRRAADRPVRSDNFIFLLKAKPFNNAKLNNEGAIETGKGRRTYCVSYSSQRSYISIYITLNKIVIRGR